MAKSRGLPNHASQLLCPGIGPSFGFLLGQVQQVAQARRFVSEDSLIPLLPQLPADEDDQRANSFTMRWNRACRHCVPNLRDCQTTSPSMRVQGGTISPGGDGHPEQLGVGAFEEQVHGRLKVSDAQRAEIAVRPTSLHQSVSTPKSVLQEEPCKKSALWGCPDRPDILRHSTANLPLELQSVC